MKLYNIIVCYRTIYTVRPNYSFLSTAQMATNYVLSLICLWYAYKGVYDACAICDMRRWRSGSRTGAPSGRSSTRAWTSTRLPCLPSAPSPTTVSFPSPLPSRLPSFIHPLHQPPSSASTDPRLPAPSRSPLLHPRPSDTWGFTPTCPPYSDVNCYCWCQDFSAYIVGLYIYMFWLSFCMWICCCT